MSLGGLTASSRPALLLVLCVVPAAVGIARLANPMAPGTRHLRGTVLCPSVRQDLHILSPLHAGRRSSSPGGFADTAGTALPARSRSHRVSIRAPTGFVDGGRPIPAG